MSSLDKNDSKVDGKPSYLRGKEAKYAIGMNRGPLPASLEGQGNDIAGVECIQGANGASPLSQEKKTQNLKRHCQRFWYCYVLFGIILAAILLPILFVFIIPAIAQRILDNSKLVIMEAQIMQPRPDSVQLTMLSTINLAGVSVKMDPMTVGLFVPQLNNRPFVELYLPAKKVHGNTTLGVSNQSTPIIYHEGWQMLVDNAVNLGAVLVEMEGTSTVHMGKLHAKLKMKKKVTSKALNRLKGFTIETPTLLLSPEADGTNLIANAMLPNPSVMTVEIGNTTLDLLSGDLVIGNATINDLIIRPGNHSAPVRGILDLHKIMQNLPSIINSQGTAILNGYLEVTSMGTSVTYEGVAVPYYEKVLKNLTLTAQIPILGLLVNTLHGITDENASTLMPPLNLTDGLGDGSSDSLKSLNYTRLVEKLVENYGKP